MEVFHLLLALIGTGAACYFSYNVRPSRIDGGEAKASDACDAANRLLRERLDRSDYEARFETHTQTYALYWHGPPTPLQDWQEVGRYDRGQIGDNHLDLYHLFLYEAQRHMIDLGIHHARPTPPPRTTTSEIAASSAPAPLPSVGRRIRLGRDENAPS